MREIYTATNAGEAFKGTLQQVLELGTELKAVESKSKSTGSNKTSQEILNYHLVIEDPRQRLFRNTKRTFNLPGAIARFIWMMAGNNRLADIEFYWGRAVTPFSDDAITVPGSSYGARMFNSSPGLDQIDAIIHRLQDDPSTRRAAVSIYQPIDAVRESRDIPCTFGLFFHVRQEQLVSTVIMRSNNAFILLPYNIFEFSLLAEVIAQEVGVSLGRMNYNAMSMHLYEENFAQAREVADNHEALEEVVFPSMPREPSPMQEIKKLIRLEARVRHISAGLNNDNINEWLKTSIKIDDDEIRLHEYWRQFFYLLLYYIVSKKTNDKEALKKVADKIQDPYKKFLNSDDWTVMQKALPAGVQQDLFGAPSENTNYLAFNQYTHRLKSLEALCAEYNTEATTATGKTIGFDTYIQLRDELVGDSQQALNMAARNQSPQLLRAEFLAAVERML